MKLVTRYLLRHLSRPWFYIMAGFSIIVILVDLFGSFVDFTEAGTSIQVVLLYYAILLPTYLPYLLPVSLLLALLYALWQLGKNSELTAMRACGRSLTQLITPYLITGLLASLILLAINEMFNPWAMHWTRQFKAMQGSKQTAQIYLEPNLTYKNAPGLRDWLVDFFDTRPSSSFEMRGINLTQQRPDDTIEFKMVAARARWIDSHWWFENVQTQYYDAHGERAGPVESSPSLEMTMLSETPKDFMNETKDSSERSAIEILNFIRVHQGISKVERNRKMVDFHSRLAAPWLCFIVILIGVPFGIHTGRRGMGLGILLALLVFFAYYILMGLGLAYGKQMMISPVLAGWFPGSIFFVLGLVLLRRIR